MTQITESGGRQNIFPTEPAVLVDSNYTSYPEDAEKVNGRWAMIGFIALTRCIRNHWSNYSGIF